MPAQRTKPHSKNKTSPSKKATSAAKRRKQAGKKPVGAARAKAASKSPARGKAKGPTSSRPARPAAKRPAPTKGKIKGKAKVTPREKEREKALREKEREKALREKEREKALREKEREKALREKERELAQKAKAAEKLRAQKEKEKLAAQREKERELALRAKEAEKLRAQKAKQKEQAEQLLEAERLRRRQEKDAERQRQRDARFIEKERLRAERLAEKEHARLEKLAEKERLRREREAEKERIRLEREAERERLRKEKEAALEAYRKAKEVEQQRLRSEREAAKKALEGRISRQAGRLRGSGARLSTSTRVYSPLSIPNQSGTRVGGQSASKFANLRSLPPPPDEQSESRPATLPPPPPERRPETVEERYKLIAERLATCDEEFRREYEVSYLMSWIYHDSALEGVVYTYEELKTGIDPTIVVVPDSTLQSVCDDIRRHKAAIELVKELGEKKRQPVTIDILKRIYLTLHPEEGDLKTVRYRRDVPQHRLYFHEYAPPDKIGYKVRQVFDWLNGPEPKKLKDPLKIAGRVQYDLLRIFPFEKDSGKVARLFMNVILLRSEHPPALIHSAERQRYYEALRGNLATILSMLQESVENALLSIEKRLDERETRLRAIIS